MLQRTRPRKKIIPEARAPDWSEPRAEEPERQPLSRELRTVFLALASVVIVAGIVGVLFRQTWWVDLFAAGLATETTGILITLVFVHRLLERQERSGRLRGSIGALRRSSRALAAMAQAWARLIAGSLARPPFDTLQSLTDLFAPQYVESMTYADPSRRRSGETGEQMWVRALVEQIVAARDKLNQIIVAYSASLDPAYVEAVEEIVDDGYLDFVQALAASQPNAREWRVRMNAARAARETHLVRLSSAIRLHNRLASEAATVRSRRIGPRTGSVGMELPLDHDLRVELRVGHQWWNGAPAVGELRATEP